jgi:hypothetical protein
MSNFEPVEDDAAKFPARLLEDQQKVYNGVQDSIRDIVACPVEIDVERRAPIKQTHRRHSEQNGTA